MKKVRILIPVLIAVLALTGLAIGSNDTDINSKTEEKSTVAEATHEPEVSALEEKITAYDDDGNEISIDEVDKSEYDGFIFSAEGKVKTSDGVRHIGGNMYAADSMEEMAGSVDEDAVAYIEPNYEFALFDEDSQALSETVEVIKPGNESKTDDDDDFDLLGGWSSSPNDPYVGKQYSINLQNIRGAWKSGVYGADNKVVVSVIDSGLYTNQEDIDYNRVVKGKSYVGGTGTQDGYSHGTMVTGVILASQNNRKGIAGAAPGVYVMPMKVFNSKGKSNGEGIFKAIYDSIDAGVDVINMSLGTKNYSYSFKKACEAASNAGIIVVAAAGNSGTSAIEYPAAFDSVIGVGSVGPDGNRSSFSEMGASVDVAAAGENLYGLYNSDKTPYCICNGTSFACPQVAALAAMVKAIDKSYTTSKFLNLLKRTSSNYTESKGPKWNQYTGYGIVNFGNVIEEVKANYIDMDQTSVVCDDSVPYDGTEKEVNVTCTYNGKKLVKGKDYTVAYKDNIEVGTATVIVKGKGKYTGTVYETFEIYDPYISFNANIDANGVASMPLISGLKEGYIANVNIDTDNINVRITRSAIESIGNYGIKFTGKVSSVELDGKAISSLVSQMGEADEIYLKFTDSEYRFDNYGVAEEGYTPSKTGISVKAKIGLEVPQALANKNVCAVNTSKKAFYGRKLNGVLTFEAPVTGKYVVASADPYAKIAASKLKPKATVSVSGKKLKIKASVNTSSLSNMGYRAEFKYLISSSKSSGYKTVGTTPSKSYTYGGVKKGKKYYIKVKVLVKDRNDRTVATKTGTFVSKKI